MKKKSVLFFACLILLTLFTAAFWKPKNTINRNNAILTGTTCKDFVIGMKNKTVYNLQDLLGKHFIVLTFLDAAADSAKLTAQISNEKLSIPSFKSGILWLNITRDNQHAEINEITSVLKIRYRTLLENIPRAYLFPSSPVVIIIDPHGVIQFVYIGYSPTIINDIRDWLKGVK
jgi:cytochrome oxidase Cu insertion factor (SCO1/SenC/PrrC family)